VEIGLIAGSVFALVIIAVPTLKSIWYTYDIPGGETRPQLDALIKKGEDTVLHIAGFALQHIHKCVKQGVVRPAALVGYRPSGVKEAIHAHLSFLRYHTRVR
jgi:hypothetical protein